ncbi:MULTISPECIES: GbsR/MarR family transcriptional regulator [unclassified Agarivorans]|uniref:GbsR/MarR family transcriptional regulator n=1 Tax=unclassified Agarivorans TaxID=2636026 RepID=UPI0026E22CD2|nr:MULTISPECIES: GbsR/MarR family transcriptional regulator [unclassified Agarivorans]MDO6685839.1 GbsR/MarR family transcriptional regulator [Agarivorans sp. 3_MG-2023]MDO6716046.1 GbsR/MarR family transcriptional regulator [Agarivorans sp. 2_MG-2023]
MQLSEKSQAFVLHFGEMGSRWGFNRTVGQILALLVINQHPLHAEKIMQQLGISRGNVSMGLKELQSWRLVKLSHQAGQRREFFTAAGSIWEMARTVFEERSKREVDPTLSLLRSNLLETPENEEDQFTQQKMEEIHDLLELITQWSYALNTMNPDKLQSLMKMGSGISRILELKDKIVGNKGSAAS